MSNCGSDISKSLSVQPSQESIDNNKTSSIKIGNTHGDVIGTSVSGYGHTIGKNIVIGSGSINVNENQLQKIPNEYADALKKFTESLNQQFKDQEVTKDQVQEINNTLEDLAKETENIKPEEKEKINPGERRILNGKFGRVCTNRS